MGTLASAEGSSENSLNDFFITICLLEIEWFHDFLVHGPEKRLRKALEVHLKGITLDFNWGFRLFASAMILLSGTNFENDFKVTIEKTKLKLIDV